MTRISIKAINQNLINAQYAVRGPIVGRASEIAGQMKQGKIFPFNKIISCNIGNPQSLGQQSITYIRDFLSLVTNPSLINKIEFSPDIVARAKKHLLNTPSIGAYTGTLYCN